MGKKGKPRGKSFSKGEEDERINRDGRPLNPQEAKTDKPTRMRESQSIYEQISTAKFQGGVPIGATLRPKPDDKDTDKDKDVDEEDFDTQNWVVDQQKLFDATNDALQKHNAHSGCNHTPKFKKEQMRKIGFGVSVSFRCCFKNCKFTSDLYKLYEESTSGQPLPNVQVGVAMAKSSLTPKTVDLLNTTLNIASPSPSHLQKTYSKTLLHSTELAETALADNRATVISAKRLLGELKDGEIPEVDVATDGAYSNRSYHFPTGKSDSVSCPVIEQVTGLGLLIEHENLSHRDGTLPENIHINSAETIAAQKNIEKCYQAPKNPLYFSTVTIDGDSSVAKALVKAKESIGESHPLKRRACYFHGESAGSEIDD